MARNADRHPSEASGPGFGSTPSDGRPPLEERPEEGLDPSGPVEWDALRRLGHRMVDEVIELQRDLRERPAWQPLPSASRAALRVPPPRLGQGADAAYEAFREHVLPYPFGNNHPRAWGWVNGQGTPLAALAEMLAAVMDPNVWGGEQSATYVEAQVVDWLIELLGFAPGASGLLTSGASLANLIGIAAARDAAGGGDVTLRGLHALDSQLVVYTSAEAHNSVDKAGGILGVGRDSVRHIPVDSGYRMKVDELEDAIAMDRAEGRRPACVVATAGTVNTGAIDPLDDIADLCAREAIWLHVDGAFGALAALSPNLRPLLSGMERADSIAFDLHKWMFMPIEVGCILVRSPAAHRRPFSPHAAYLETFQRGPASGPLDFASLGPQLTRGFRALKVWLSVRAHGTDAFARLVEQGVRQARRLESLVAAHPHLELLAPVPLNVVCFRYRPDRFLDEPAIDALNRELLQRLQESGTAVVSSTVLPTGFALRAAFTNHRTRSADIDVLVEAVSGIGDEL